MTPDLIYRAQFDLLRGWIGALQPDELSTPSVLAGWSVVDLVAHLAGTGQSIAALRPAEDGAAPMSVASYLAGYAASADQIADTARQTAAGAGAGLPAALDDGHAAACQALAQLAPMDRVVASRRGPIRLGAFLDTRIIELVVHSGDLARSLPSRTPPTILPAAQLRVLGVLRQMMTVAAADPQAALAAADALDPADFIELSAGRTPPSADLPAALAQSLPLF